MDFPASLFPLSGLLVLDILALLLLADVVWRVAWRQLTPQGLNAWMGAGVMVLGLWQLKGGFEPGLSYHLLGAAVLTLMMGPWLALIAVALLLLANCLAGQGDLLALGLNWLSSGLVPVAVVSLGLRLAQRYLPDHLFVYVFLNAFLSGGLSLVAASLAGLGLLAVFGVYPWSRLLDDAFPYYLLLSWSEAFTSGLMLAILVVYKPAWVVSFDDARYLNDKLD